MATGSKEWSFTRSGTGGTAYIRLDWSSSFNASTSTSTITVVPYLKYSATNAGSDQRVFGSTASSTAGIYGNGTKLYALNTSDAGGTSPSGKRVLYNNNASGWGRLYCGTGSISTFSVKHNTSGRATFTIGFYGAVERMYDYIIYGPFGDTASDSIKIDVSAPYSISYDANGGSGAPSSQAVFATYSYNLSSTIPVKSGYTFLGWSTNSTATTATYQPSELVEITGNLALYAIWQKNTYVLSISQGNGSTVSVNRNGTPLLNGATIYYGDILNISISANTGYNISTHTVNNTDWTSGTYTVNSAVSIISTATLIQYVLSVTTSANGVTLDINRTSSPIAGASTGAIGNGATLYYNDVIGINYILGGAYQLLTATVNNIDISEENLPYVVTVTNNVIVSITAKLGAIVYIGNEAYQAFIGDGTNWNQYQAYIGNGASFDQY